MSESIVVSSSSTQTLLSPQQLGAHTRKAYKRGKDKPAWVARVQQERTERNALHKQREAELERNRDQIEAMAQRIREEQQAKRAASAVKPTPQKPIVYGNGRVRRTPEQEQQFKLLQLKSRLR